MSGFVHPGVNFVKRESPIVLELDKDEEWDDNINTEALMRPPLDRGPLTWDKRHKVGVKAIANSKPNDAMNYIMR